MILGYYLRDPSVPVFVSSVVPNIREYSTWVHLLLQMPTHLLLVGGWISAVALAVIFYYPVYVLIFMTTEMR
jgi:hypothetical protein